MKSSVHVNHSTDSLGHPLYLLKNGKIEVLLSSFAACIRSIKVLDSTGKFEEITLGWDDDRDWVDNSPFFGVTVGRFANRIANSQFSIDGQSFRVEANDGQNHLHGGPQGFHVHLWTGEPWSEEHESGVTFRRVSPDGEGGYPGNLDVSVRVSLNDRNVVKTIFEAHTDKPTPVNLTNHTYFNLGGPHHLSVLDHQLWSLASQWLPVGEGTIPTGEVAEVAGTAFDFRVPKLIGRDIGKLTGGYDNFLVLDATNAPLNGVREAARVTLASKGRTLRLYTDQPGFQLYTGNYLHYASNNGTRKSFKTYGGFCVESQKFPDSLGHKTWVPPILRPGETYRHEFHYAFELN